MDPGRLTAVVKSGDGEGGEFLLADDELRRRARAQPGHFEEPLGVGASTDEVGLAC